MQTVIVTNADFTTSGKLYGHSMPMWSELAVLETPFGRAIGAVKPKEHFHWADRDVVGSLAGFPWTFAVFANREQFDAFVADLETVADLPILSWSGLTDPGMGTVDEYITAMRELRASHGLD